MANNWRKTGPSRYNTQHLLPLAADHTPVPLIRTEFEEGVGSVSPDGRWIAYVSNETGRREIYARPFPSGDRRWQVSVDGGFEPQWRRDGRELFFVLDQSADGRRFLLNQPSGSSLSSPITVVVNWQEELKRRVPTR